MSALLVAAIALLVAVGFAAALDSCPGVGGRIAFMAPVESRYGGNGTGGLPLRWTNNIAARELPMLVIHDGA